MHDTLHQNGLGTSINGYEPWTAMMCVRCGAADSATLDGNGEKQLDFTCIFPRQPALAWAALDAGTAIIGFRVKAWQQDGQGNYTGCTVMARRSRNLPGVLVLLSALLNYDVTEPAAGENFSRTAVMRLT